MEKRGRWVFALESNRSISTLTIGSITAPPQTDATSILSVEDFLWRGLVQDSCDLKHAWLWETETVSTGQRTTSSLLVYVGNHCHTVCLSEHVLEPQQLPAVPSIWYGAYVELQSTSLLLMEHGKEPPTLSGTHLWTPPCEKTLSLWETRGVIAQVLSIGEEPTCKTTLLSASFRGAQSRWDRNSCL